MKLKTNEIVTGELLKKITLFINLSIIKLSDENVVEFAYCYDNIVSPLIEDLDTIKSNLPVDLCRLDIEEFRKGKSSIIYHLYDREYYTRFKLDLIVSNINNKLKIYFSINGKNSTNIIYALKLAHIKRNYSYQKILV